MAFESTKSSTEVVVVSLSRLAITVPPPGKSRMPRRRKMSWKNLPIEIRERIVELFLENVLAGLKLVPSKPSSGTYTDMDLIRLGHKQTGPQQFCISCRPGRLFILGSLGPGERLVIDYDNELAQPTIAHLKTQLRDAILPLATSSLDMIQPVLVSVAFKMLRVRLRSTSRDASWRPSGCAWTKAELECEVLDKFTSKKKISVVVKNAKQEEMSIAFYPEPRGLPAVSPVVVDKDVNFIKAFCKRMRSKASRSIRRRKGTIITN